MDERAIYEEILGQLAIIVNQQTQDIVNSINNKKTGEQQQIEVLVSGNTMSVIDVVTNNPETAKRVENVASSFEVLNQQLERYESVCKGIQGAFYITGANCVLFVPTLFAAFAIICVVINRIFFYIFFV